MSSPSGNLLREFKGDLRAPLPLHPLEKALIVVVALNVCSLPWMMGGMRTWAQLISFGLALAASILSLVPRTYSGDLVHGDDYHVHPYRRLIRWPFWWVGLLFFGYVLIQALNPAWEFVQMETGWGMRKIDHIDWLPTGMSTPFEMMNPWRQMMIWAIPFLTICALWVGITRRRSVQLLLSVIVVNLVLFCLFAIGQRVLDGNKIYGTVSSANEFFGAFVYRNHAGGYLGLGFMLTAAFAAWVHLRALRRFSRSSPAALLAFAAIIVAVAVGVSYSRGSVVALICGVGWIIVIGVIWLISRPPGQGQPVIVTILALLLLGAGGLGLSAFNVERTYDRFQQFWEGNHTTWEVRQLATQATQEMWSERPAYGWGAGSFRFLFPRYQRNYPEIQWARPDRQSGFLFWEYAHNDWIQTPAEVGWVGSGLLGLMLLFGLGYLTRHRAWRHPFVVIGVGGCLMTLGHARVEFVFGNPAIVLLWGTLAGVILVVAHLETRPKPNPGGQNELRT